MLRLTQDLYVRACCVGTGLVEPYYQWRSKYAGATVSELRRLKELEAENGKLKRVYADLASVDYKLARPTRVSVVLRASDEEVERRHSQWPEGSWRRGNVLD